MISLLSLAKVVWIVSSLETYPDRVFGRKYGACVQVRLRQTRLFIKRATSPAPQASILPTVTLVDKHYDLGEKVRQWPSREKVQGASLYSCSAAEYERAP